MQLRRWCHAEKPATAPDRSNYWMTEVTPGRQYEQSLPATVGVPLLKTVPGIVLLLAPASQFDKTVLPTARVVRGQ